MDTIINSVTSNRILLVISILLASLIIYSILKRLVKIIVILIIALILYLGYVNYRGEKVDDTIQHYLNKWGKELNDLQKKKNKISGIIELPVKNSR